ncbi:hypothetical protein QFZ68_000174 [Streptomyces sp. V1I6]|nr:hypothetical protein [Streptomyces sp. V1I6]
MVPRSGADAIHPGHGFLSENADFAQAVIDTGLTWIGPPPQAIRDLGDKVAARHIAQRAGAPLIAGTTDPVSGADVLIWDNVRLPLAPYRSVRHPASFASVRSRHLRSSGRRPLQTHHAVNFPHGWRAADHIVVVMCEDRGPGHVGGGRTCLKHRFRQEEAQRVLGVIATRFEKHDGEKRPDVSGRSFDLRGVYANVS